LSKPWHTAFPYVMLEMLLNPSWARKRGTRCKDSHGNGEEKRVCAGVGLMNSRCYSLDYNFGLVFARLAHLSPTATLAD
jgi:hypothetical protein